MNGCDFSFWGQEREVPLDPLSLAPSLQKCSEKNVMCVLSWKGKKAPTNFTGQRNLRGGAPVRESITPRFRTPGLQEPDKGLEVPGTLAPSLIQFNNQTKPNHQKIVPSSSCALPYWLCSIDADKEAHTQTQTRLGPVASHYCFVLQSRAFLLIYSRKGRTGRNDFFRPSQFQRPSPFLFPSTGPEMVQTESLRVGPASAARSLRGTRMALISQLGEQAPGSDQLCVIPGSITS